jgi:hypothetical protein
MTNDHTIEFSFNQNFLVLANAGTLEIVTVIIISSRKSSGNIVAVAVI